MARPKGFANWRASPESTVIVAQVRSVLAEYQDHLPLTVRQIFYRLVGQYGYDKTEKAYDRLCDKLVRARRAQMIGFDVIRDDGTVHNNYPRYSDPAAFWRAMQKRADSYVRDKQDGQPVYVELWCEAAGMVPQLERVANAYSVPVYSTGGFSSVTVTYEIAQRALDRDRPTVFLHVGDYDPSGESIFDAMTTDAKAFLLNQLAWKHKDDEAALAVIAPGGVLYLHRDLPDEYPDLRATRVALTDTQVNDYDLPTAPPKPSDTRSRKWIGETCQLEALPPDELAAVVESAIRAVLNLGLLDEIGAAEREERKQISANVAAFIKGE